MGDSKEGLKMVIVEQQRVGIQMEVEGGAAWSHDHRRSLTCHHLWAERREQQEIVAEWQTQRTLR